MFNTIGFELISNVQMVLGCRHITLEKENILLLLFGSRFNLEIKRSLERLGFLITFFLCLHSAAIRKTVSNVVMVTILSHAPSSIGGTAKWNCSRLRREPSPRWYSAGSKCRAGDNTMGESRRGVVMTTGRLSIWWETDVVAQEHPFLSVYPWYTIRATPAAPTTLDGIRFSWLYLHLSVERRYSAINPKLVAKTRVTNEIKRCLLFLSTCLLLPSQRKQFNNNMTESRDLKSLLRFTRMIT